jgi:hypothetical protein
MKGFIIMATQEEMSQPELEPMPVTITVTIADASDLPVYHVNVMTLRGSSDEFFFTLGVIHPPDQAEIASLPENRQMVAQPVFRFAISHDTMEKFLTVMAGQFEQQTTLRKQLQQQSSEVSENE